MITNKETDPEGSVLLKGENRYNLLLEFEDSISILYSNSVTNLSSSFLRPFFLVLLRIPSK